MTEENEAFVDPEEAERDREAIWSYLLRLRRRGFTDHRLLSALESVPRRLFVPHDAREAAYIERALPIECGQTISAPEIVAMMTSALEVQP
ncbi:MAG: protein-L-isoaspartate O-methyltransferase, partial [Bauldia sp.]